MAKTNDPHAAAIKAWQTRARNAGGGGVVQQGKDWIDPERTAELLQVWAYGEGEYGYKSGRDPTTRTGKEMTKALKTLPVYRGEVHRGMSMTPAELGKLTVGKTFTVRKHSSASKSKSVAEDFADGHVARGRRRVVLTVIGRGRDFSKAKVPNVIHREKEVVLMAGTKLKIVSLVREEGYEAADETFYITAREVRD
jgi:hypothetical protein